MCIIRSIQFYSMRHSLIAFANCLTTLFTLLRDSMMHVMPLVLLYYQDIQRGARP